MSRAIDTEVAEKIMGSLSGRLMTQSSVRHIPKYTNDLTAAWEVMEKMTKDFRFGVVLDIRPRSKKIRVVFYRGSTKKMEDKAEGVADTVAKAICVAALKGAGYINT